MIGDWITLLVSSCSSGEIQRYLRELDPESLERWKEHFPKIEPTEKKTYITTKEFLND